MVRPLSGGFSNCRAGQLQEDRCRQMVNSIGNEPSVLAISQVFDFVRERPFNILGVGEEVYPITCDATFLPVLR